VTAQANTDSQKGEKRMIIFDGEEDRVEMRDDSAEYISEQLGAQLNAEKLSAAAGTYADAEDDRRDLEDESRSDVKRTRKNDRIAALAQVGTIQHTAAERRHKFASHMCEISGEFLDRLKKEDAHKVRIEGQEGVKEHWCAAVGRRECQMNARMEQISASEEEVPIYSASAESCAAEAQEEEN